MQDLITNELKFIFNDIRPICTNLYPILENFPRIFQASEDLRARDERNRSSFLQTFRNETTIIIAR